MKDMILRSAAFLVLAFLISQPYIDAWRNMTLWCLERKQHWLWFSCTIAAVFVWFKLNQHLAAFIFNSEF